ncbi:helix-turn-helix domain-containing protein [Candidatus Desantisbacteria bacterium]|nr:helix-turn-helix domain-containing protein [Candidatus Desantisbacteria bacterium]
MNKKLRKKIRIELIKNDTSAAEIARNLGVHRTYINNVIASIVKTQYVREAIAKTINIPIEELWPN